VTTVRAAVVVFIASFCTLVIELVAGRVLAPYVGVSLYTWTSIIGVVLAGISAGAYAGGWLADRKPAESTLGWLLLASGLTAMLIAPATTFLAADDGLLTNYGIATTLLQRVVLLSFVLFFLPSFFLGMISPVAVKIAVRDLATTGRTVGKIYAFSTLGSIVGTFTTGFFLIARFGTKVTLIGTGAALIVTALVLGGIFGRRGRALSALVVAIALASAGLWPGTMEPPHQRDALDQIGALGVVHSEESEYYTINVERTVRDDTGSILNALHLDHLVHSYSDPDDPGYLEYEYLRIFSDIIDWTARRKPVFRVLFVGGGGYTLPRLIEQQYPNAEIHVVEIDPAVTRVAYRFFGVAHDTAIRTINADARWYAMHATEPYDAIFIDAFNDLSVPYHLTTREFTAELRRLLAPDGVIAANVIDDYANGRFLASYARTLESLFGADQVAVLAEAPEDVESARSTFVVVASAEARSLVVAIAGHPVEARGGIVLTDSADGTKPRRSSPPARPRSECPPGCGAVRTRKPPGPASGPRSFGHRQPPHPVRTGRGPHRRSPHEPPPSAR
jgi:predicted membrane-bound spermidine synthase